MKKKAFEIDKDNFLILDKIMHFSLEDIESEINQINIQISTTSGEYISVEYRSKNEAKKYIKGITKAINKLED